MISYTIPNEKKNAAKSLCTAQCYHHYFQLGNRNMGAK